MPGVNQTLHCYLSLSALCFICKFSTHDPGILFDMTITPRPSCVNVGVSISSRNGTSVSCRSSDNATSNQISQSLLWSDVESDRRASLFFPFLKEMMQFQVLHWIILHHTQKFMKTHPFCFKYFFSGWKTVYLIFIHPCFFKKKLSHKINDDVFFSHDNAVYYFDLLSAISDDRIIGWWR